MSQPEIAEQKKSDVVAFPTTEGPKSLQEAIEVRMHIIARRDAEQDEVIKEAGYMILLEVPQLRTMYRRKAEEELAAEQKARDEALAAEQKARDDALAAQQKAKDEAEAAAVAAAARKRADGQRALQKAIEGVIAKHKPVEVSEDDDRHFWDRVKADQKVSSALRAQWEEHGFSCVCSITDGERVAAMRGASLKQVVFAKKKLQEDRGLEADSQMSEQRRKSLESMISEREPVIEMLTEVLRGVFGVQAPGDAKYHSRTDVYRDVESRIRTSPLAWVMEGPNSASRPTEAEANVAGHETPSERRQANMKAKEAFMSEAMSLFDELNGRQGHELSDVDIRRMLRSIEKLYRKHETAHKAFRAKAINFSVMELRQGRTGGRNIYGEVLGLTPEEVELEAKTLIEEQDTKQATEKAKQLSNIPTSGSRKRMKGASEDGKKKKKKGQKEK